MPDLVFLGGAVTSLLVTDEGAGEPRPTLDVDAIAEITSYAEYAAFGLRMRALGFSEDARDGSPVCRWVHGEATLDVMPLDEKILGFSNRWYREAMAAATSEELQRDLAILRSFWLQRSRLSAGAARAIFASATIWKT